ncbi:nuclear transport factor 2 family protein [Microbispora sp. NEAU-D428]|uniref:nuclear transport factor 2 family protein n=1 Tax=Microbispora sitophila TaxID=2771537 RepID=UPI0018660F8E|nr:nuclear transport factor 2 family protein [Microbispora sitophila]MBE3010162.1 nuclear transport factor 2 family protein [Microbispora sitophila]
MRESGGLAVVDVVDRYFSAYNTHDLDAVMGCYSSVPRAVGPGGPFDGHSEVASYHVLIWQAFPDVRLTVWQKIVTDAAVAAAAVGTGTHAGPFPLTTGEVVEATGRRVSVRSCWLFDIAGGLIDCSEVFYDQLELCVQLGLRLLA